MMLLTQLSCSSNQCVFPRVSPDLTQRQTAAVMLLFTRRFIQSAACVHSLSQLIASSGGFVFLNVDWRALTELLEVVVASSIPHSLPHAAPISRDGMKTPAETARPYVQHARKKYTSVNNPIVRWS